MKEKEFVIYGLIDPETDELRYVGQTTNFNCRKYEYLRKFRKDGRHVSTWVNSLHKKQLLPIIEILDKTLDLEKLNNLEEFYVDYYKAIGCRLVNHVRGGKNKIPDLRTRIKISKSNGGEPFVDQNEQKYDTINEACKKLKVNRSSVKKILKHKDSVFVTNGYTFMYIKEFEKLGREKSLNHMQFLLKRAKEREERILITSEGEVFNKSEDCKNHYKLSNSKLTALCSGDIKSLKGVYFTYVYPYENIEEKFEELKWKKYNYGNNSSYKLTARVKNENGYVYKSFLEILNKTGMKASTLILLLKGKHKTFKKQRFSYEI